MRNRLTKLLTTCLLVILALPAAGAEEFLKPDEAFRVSATPEGDRIRVSWDIADGYYLYRAKIRFQTDTPGTELGNPRFPPAQTREDPFFGEVEIYRGETSIDVPLKATEGGTVTLEARSQGCADAGLCYPPHRQTLLVAVAPTAPPPALDPGPLPDEAGGGAVAALGGFADEVGLGAFDDDILPAEEAFRFSALVEGGNQLRLRWDIADGTYLYADKIRLELEGDGARLGEFRLPPPKVKHDSVTPEGEIGDVEAYVDDIDLLLPLLRTAPDATEVQLTASYQGCAERGICYPPQKTSVALALPAVPPDQVTASESAPPPAATAQAAPDSEPVAEQDQIAAMIQGSSTWVIIGSFFLIGLGLAFTPCVFPMVPILSGIITGQGRDITSRRAFTLSLVYVLAMALTYTVAGVIAALSGENLQAALQNPWALGIFAGVFVLLALSMFGFYDLQLPASWQSKLSEFSNRQRGGTLTGVAIMGLLSALIVGPCVAPPLAGALIYIGQTGDAVLGGAALFAMSMGMGAPLVALGTSAGKLLPRAGAWMDSVKAVFGVVMLGVAIYLLERILPEAVSMLLWGLLLIVSGIYMGAFLHLAHDASGWRKLWKGLGTAMAVYGALMLVGAASGGRDTIQPLKGIAFAGGGQQESHLAFERIKTVDDLDQAIARANASGKSVMLDFYADWCVYCKQMERNTFPSPDVQQALANTVKLQADVTDNDELDKALLGHFGIPAPPAILFFDVDGQERRNYRLLGYMGPDEFASHVRKALL
jgi:thiol:disulfide interchange protein DsbD